MRNLYWLPEHENFKAAIAATKEATSLTDQLNQLRQLAKHNLDFTQILRLDRRLQNLDEPGSSSLPTLKLAILASATVDHLAPAIRVAALRRGLLFEIYIAPYGQYRQEILNPASTLYQFAPDVVLLALSARDAGVKLPLSATLEEVTDKVEARAEEWVQLWDTLSSQSQAAIVHQTMVVPVEQLFGHYDAMVPTAPANILWRLNQTLRTKAAQHQVLLLDVEGLAAYIGKQSWCNHPLWHHSKQDISPLHAPLYGDHLARQLAAIRGLSYKCLVLDLDNTLWGGVIGDDGLGGIELGQGTGVGEAFLAFQLHVKALKERGIILAVCSKNDEVNALEAFTDHPAILLRREDFSAFVANWEDKATNLQRIAAELNIGLDSLVFFDDNPVERAIVRQFTPAVAVPEVPEDPAWYERCLSDAGYFEAVAFSRDDLGRTEQYLANNQRNQLKGKTHSLENFLAQLNMEMIVSRFDPVSRSRVTQLINKSNQFNLTTRRYTEAQVKQMEEDQDILSLQIRLKDEFGDNGIISVIIAKPAISNTEKMLHIDTWLMSCRVLGRQVEQEVLNVLVEQAQNQSYKLLQGEYISTKKNEMVRDHYFRLGFDLVGEKHEEDGTIRSLWKLDLANFVKPKTFIHSAFI